MKKILLMIGAAAVALGASATEYTYTGGAVSPADGKVEILCDHGAITRLSLRSDYGDPVILKGDALNFADGAWIVPNQNKSVISNSFTAAGTLNFGATNMTWTSTASTPGLTKDSYTTVFQGVRLDDISPVSAVGANTINGKAMLPLFVSRGEGTMLLEYHCTNGTYVAAVQVELKQDGDDVVAKTVKAAHLGSSSVANGEWGFGAFTETKSSVRSNPSGYSVKGPDSTGDSNGRGYNVKTLVFGLRRDAYVYSGNFLSKSFNTVVATNTALEEIEILYGIGGYSHKLSSFGLTTLYPHHVKFAGGVLSAQFHNLSDAYTKCVKIELKQSGADIVARVAYAKYAKDHDKDYDFDDISDGDFTPYTEATMSNWSDTENGRKNKYGIDFLSLRRKSRSRVTLPVSGTLDLTTPLGGNGVEVTFEAASASEATVNLKAANTMTDSALIVNGPNTPASGYNISCYVKNADALPAGETELYGSAKMVFDTRRGNNWRYGTSDGKSAITAHPGSQIYVTMHDVFKYDTQSIVLDAAELLYSSSSNPYRTYVNDLTLLNGASVSYDGSKVVIPAVGMQASSKWQIAGEGLSQAPGISLRGSSSTHAELEIAVEDTVAGDAADFIIDGDIDVESGYLYAAIVKTGLGTMRMDGSITYTKLPTRIIEGTLLLNKTEAVASGGSFSLEGGTLALAAGTANAAASIAVTAPSSLVVPAGATLNLASLTLGEDATLSITGDGAVGGVIVSSTLSDATLEKIRLNEKTAIQSSNGALCRPGLIISVY